MRRRSSRTHSRSASSPALFSSLPFLPGATMSRLSLTVVLLAALMALCGAEEVEKHHAEEAVQAGVAAKPSSPLTAIHLPSSFNLSHNMIQTLAVAGAVVVGLVGAAGVLAVVLPMFGFRMCYLFGTCDTYAHAYLAPTAYDAYAYSQPVYAGTAYAKSYDGATNELPYSYEGYQHPQTVATYPTTNTVAANAYQKRSLEYVGPILKMLSNAYEKYNHPAQSKSVEGKASSAAASETKTE